MRLKNIFLSIIVMLFLQSTHAQQTVYFSKDSTYGVKKKSNQKQSSETNVIKIAPLGFLFGLVPVFYERQISELFSIQLGAGITIKNYAGNIGNGSEFKKTEDDEYSFTWNASSSNGIYNYNDLGESKNRKYSTGMYFQIQPRIYFENEGIDGSYIAFSYEMKQYNFSSRKVIPGLNDFNFSNDYYKEYDKFSDIAVNFGFQNLYDRISIDYSAGVALRSKNNRRYAYAYDNNGTVIDGFADLKKTVPVFLLSFRVGYHF